METEKAIRREFNQKMWNNGCRLADRTHVQHCMVVKQPALSCSCADLPDGPPAACKRSEDAGKLFKQAQL